MKLHVNQILPYIGHNVGALIEGIVCEIEGIDFYNEGTIIAERINYDIDSIKLGLIPLNHFHLFDDVLDEMSQCEIEMIEDNPDLVLRINYFAIQKMFEHHLDVFGLIQQGLAFDKRKKV